MDSRSQRESMSVSGWSFPGETRRSDASNDMSVYRASDTSDDMSVYRAGVEALVREAFPDELDKVDEMMVEFKGREGALIGHLSSVLARRNRDDGAGSETEDEDTGNGGRRSTYDTSEYTFATGPSGYDISTMASLTTFDASTLASLNGCGANAAGALPQGKTDPAAVSPDVETGAAVDSGRQLPASGYAADARLSSWEPFPRSPSVEVSGDGRASRNDEPARGQPEHHVATDGQSKHNAAQGRGNSASASEEGSQHGADDPKYGVVHTSPLWANEGRHSEETTVYEEQGSFPSWPGLLRKPSKNSVRIGAALTAVAALATMLGLFLAKDGPPDGGTGGAVPTVPSSPPTADDPARACRWVDVNVVFNNDSGEATSWGIEKINSSGDVLLETSEAEQGSSSLRQSYCLEEGRYRFTIRDGAGTGLLPWQQGRYNVTLDGEVLVQGRYSDKKEETLFDIGRNCHVVDVNIGFEDLSEGIWWEIQQIGLPGVDTVVATRGAVEDGGNLSGSYCLEEGQYRFAIYNEAGDDLFVEQRPRRDGRYNVTTEPTREGGPGEVIAQGGDFARTETALFRIPVRACRRLDVDIVFDDYAGEIAWGILKFGQEGDDTVIATYDAEDGERTLSKSYCLPEGRYRFTIVDEAGDGLCCERGGHGREGHYNLTLDGEAIARGGEFGRVEAVAFRVSAASSPPNQSETQVAGRHNTPPAPMLEMDGPAPSPSAFASASSAAFASTSPAVPGPASSSASPPSASPSALPSDPSCFDVPGWKDRFNDGCRWYEANDFPGCTLFGRSYEGSMGPASDNCCYCKTE